MKIKFSILTILTTLFILGACGQKSENAQLKITYTAERSRLDKGNGFIDVDGNVEANDTKKNLRRQKIKSKKSFRSRGRFCRKRTNFNDF